MNALFRKPLFLLLGLASVATALIALYLTRTAFPWEEDSTSPNRAKSNELPVRGDWLQTRENEADRTIWAAEMLAQKCGRSFEILWDSVNASTNKLKVIADFPVQEIILPDWGPARKLAHGIEMRGGASANRMLSAAQWRQQVEQFRSQGWQLDNLEFRHNQFDTNASGQPLRSKFYFSAHLANSTLGTRAMLDGDLVVNWAPIQSPGGLPPVQSIDATRLELKSREGEPFFQQILDETVTPAERSPLIDPLILYDLDRDGLSEIILVSRNLVFRRRGEDRYEGQILCRHPIEFISTAVIADFDGDGFADLLCANSRGLYLFKGSAQGTFDDPPRLAWAADPPFKNASALTCGDVNEDGRLDVFVAQYKVPTLGQVLRPYYYEANDGWPSYLLLNDRKGNFTNATDAAGLGAKRWRRTYSASLADLDSDGHLDLVVVSDFAGLDLYRNDGHGHFSDVTQQWVAEPHAFGMAHALADFNADGRLDLLMVGMPSPTVDRLEHLGLWRPYSTEDHLRRAAMTFGNRLYLARSNGGFSQTQLGDSIARSGWSWGCSAFDFDNDGFPDVYLANGLESKQSVRDYESEFWLHNIFVDESVDDATATRYFLGQFGRTRGQGWSYGGYEKNRLFLNQGGASFIDIGHLAGVSLEQDSRNVVAEDLDGDGRVDLTITTQEAWPAVKQTLKVYKNRLTTEGHWIGFRFREQAGAKSPVGSRVTIYYEGHSAVQAIVTGDSHRSQHSATLHFGLGQVQQVDKAEIKWSGGQSVSLRLPAVDHYHEVYAPQ